MTTTSRPATPFDTLRSLARTHLSPQDAERWTGLLRPGVRLRRAEADEPVVGQLGGLPRLPEDVAWPVWEEERCALSFVAMLDCAALRAVAAAQGCELPLATDGRLAFFTGFDEEEGRVVDAGDRDTWAGARVLHLPPEEPSALERPAPEDVEPYAVVPLTAVTVPSIPGSDSPASASAFGFARWQDQYQHPATSGPFSQALEPHEQHNGHQALGHPQSIQGAVEVEVAQGVLGGRLRRDDPQIVAEAARWTLLAQFDSDGDAGMSWGDCGVLYWLIRSEHLAANRFDQALLTMQCC
ncbi:YwqG family protein [Streptomyces coffeae]|nr:YwqG family protein [Streptomyces coffeae]